MDNHTGKPLLYYEMLKLPAVPHFMELLSQEKMLEESIQVLRKNFKHFQSCFSYERAKKELLEKLLINVKEFSELKEKQAKSMSE